jgi:hypothetical protein
MGCGDAEPEKLKETCAREQNVIGHPAIVGE